MKIYNAVIVPWAVEILKTSYHITWIDTLIQKLMSRLVYQFAAMKHILVRTVGAINVFNVSGATCFIAQFKTSVCQL